MYYTILEEILFKLYVVNYKKNINYSNFQTVKIHDGFHFGYLQEPITHVHIDSNVYRLMS